MLCQLLLSVTYSVIFKLLPPTHTHRLFTLIQLHSTLYYYTHPPLSSPSSQAQDRDTVVSYFRISEDVTALYQQWGERDTNFHERASNCRGVRLLQQYPFEALIAFICSSNNNIPRISLMLSKLCQRFGRWTGRYKERDYFSFPSVESLAGEECEDVLRQLAFGYRAKYVHQTAKMIVDQHGGVEWLDSLRGKPYWEAWEVLQCLPGVGGKVADCVCLMGLGHMEAVPVDTHVWRVAVRDYGVSEGSTLTTRRYREVGELERACSLWICHPNTPTHTHTHTPTHPTASHIPNPFPPSVFRFACSMYLHTANSGSGNGL